MKYFGTEIFDGRIYADFPLDEDMLLEDQFLLLTSDVGGVEYYIRDYVFVVSLSWFGDMFDLPNPKNHFFLRVFEGPKTDGKTFLIESTESDLKQFKLAFQRAIDFVQKVKEMNDDEIEALPVVSY